MGAGSAHKHSLPPFPSLRTGITWRILPIPPAPTVFDQRVIDIGPFGKYHLKTSNYAGKHGGGARFEHSTVLETRGPDLISLFRFQALTEESEAGEEPVKTDGML
jgi:hypothetical protein